MEAQKNKSPFSLKKKLFIGFGLIVIHAFLYLHVVILAEPVKEHFHLNQVETVADTHSLPLPVEDSADTMRSTQAKKDQPMVRMIPKLDEMVSLPRIEIGPF